jgi:hypothetical protein
MKRVQRRDLMAFVEEALRVQPGCFFFLLIHYRVGWFAPPF